MASEKQIAALERARAARAAKRSATSGAAVAGTIPEPTTANLAVLLQKAEILWLERETRLARKRLAVS
jgi:hypothetical protein